MITQTTCWVVRCDVCGGELGEHSDGALHFPTRPAASQALADAADEMRHRDDDTLECCLCHQERRCHSGIHQWVPWWRVVDSATVARSCLHCSTTERRDRAQVDPDAVLRVVSLRRIGGELR